MKKLLYFTFVLGGLLIASCAPDTKDDPSNPSNPATDDRDKYVATWNANENSAVAGTNTHTVNISKSTTNSTEITIANFAGLPASARAVVNNNILTIPYQQVGTIGFAKGSGTMTSATNIN